MDTKLGLMVATPFDTTCTSGKHAIGQFAGMEAQYVAVVRGEDAVEHRFAQIESEACANAFLHAIDDEAQKKLRNNNAHKKRRARQQAVRVDGDCLVDNGAARQREAYEHRRLQRAQRRKCRDSAVLLL